MTSTNNSTCSHISYFTLSGIPHLEYLNFWLGLIVISMYIIAVAGNATVIYIIKVEQELHEPMYIFLFMLSVLDLLIATTIMPQMLSIFWFAGHQITFNMCLTQMFFLHFLSALESGILVAMAVDRYVAICHPLRYTAILTHQNITKISLVNIARGMAVMIPIPLIIKRLPLWRSNNLIHSYCLHQEVMKLACADIGPNIIYGMFVIASVMGIDSVFISISYMLIVKAVVCLVKESSLKAISTCAAHICAVLAYYIPLIGLSVVHRIPNSDPNLRILFGNIYLLLPPVINPLIYGIKTKQIRNRLVKLISNRKIGSKTSQDF
ncbi:PREDICTED: olfactory receptor 51E1-like [Nanorana parkeri]|uniref:olfactory receptor 51E1-like n=1 Tax=Nanorana parkeri TaxID=125878 RepID=UPI000853F746|nr:PREDICTED: olfactory receptor 51E1-like [Nanorana parkeri]